jgi:hypothetical protein
MKQMSKTTSIEEVQIRVLSDRESDFTLIIEPWGDTHCVRPTDEYLIVARGPAPAKPELVQGQDCLTYYGWDGSTLTLYRNGESLDDPADSRPLPPATP